MTRGFCHGPGAELKIPPRGHLSFHCEASDDLPGAVDEQQRHRAEIALLQSDETDWSARFRQFDRQRFQRSAIDRELQLGAWKAMNRPVAGRPDPIPESAEIDVDH